MINRGITLTWRSPEVEVELTKCTELAYIENLSLIDTLHLG